MHFILPLSMLLALGECYTMVNYFDRRECTKGKTAQCSKIAQRVCCSAGKSKFRSTKFTGITTGDITIVWTAPECAKVNEAESNSRCVSQTQKATGAKLGGSSVRRQTGKMLRRGDDLECESTVEMDQLNMDGYSYKINYDVPQNVTDELFFHATENTPRHELPEHIASRGWPTKYDHEGTPLGMD